MSSRAFLSIYTPTYKRPALLAQCVASVKAQTVPVEQVIIPDEVGIGIDGVYAAMPQHAHQVTGEYVMVLSDDNVLVDPAFAADLQREAEANGWPPVIVFKGDLGGGTVQPLVWDAEPQFERIDLSNFAVRRPVWQFHAADWGHRYEGDFDFIHALWKHGYPFHWWDRLVYKALKISRGAPE